MAKFAVLENNKVENVIIASDLDTAQSFSGKTCVEIPEESFAGIDWLWENGQFVNPNPIYELLSEETTEGDIVNEEVV
jgi:hypothetical protein